MTSDRRKDGSDGLHSGKGKRKENCFLQDQGLLGAGCQRQVTLQVYHLVSSRRPHPVEGSQGSPEGGGCLGRRGKTELHQGTGEQMAYISEEDMFVNGFRIGVGLILDAVGSYESQFVQYHEE